MTITPCFYKDVCCVAVQAGEENGTLFCVWQFHRLLHLHILVHQADVHVVISFCAHKAVQVAYLTYGITVTGRVHLAKV